MESLKRELQVLSEQYSQKCLEIGDLVQKAEEQEHMLQHCQQEGKELLRQNQVRVLLSVPTTLLRQTFRQQGNVENIDVKYGQIVPRSCLMALRPIHRTLNNTISCIK